MSEIKVRKGRPTPVRPPVASDVRAELAMLMQLGNGQFESDNRKEALAYYARAWDLLLASEAAPAAGGNGQGLGASVIAGPAEAIFLCRRMGEAHQLRGEFDEARCFLAEAERRLGAAPDDVELGQVLAIRGSIATDLGRFSQAQRLLLRAQQLLTSSPDHHAFGAIERRLGKLYLRMGRPQEARTYFESALATFRRIGDQRGIAGTLNNLGLIHKLACEWMEAIRVMEKGLVLNEILADEAQIGALCINLGVVHLKLGQWQRAAERLERAIASNSRIGNRRGLANALIARANLAMRLRRWEEAEAGLTEAIAIARPLGLVRAEGLALESLGELFFDRGDHARAEEHLAQGLALARGLGAENELVGELGRRLGEVYASTGRLGEALVLAEEAVHIARKVGDLYEEALCHRLLARIAGLGGDGDRFRQHAGKVIERLAHMGERREQARTFLALGDVWVAQRAILAPSWRDEAQAAYQRAETLALGLELDGEAGMAALRLAELEREQGRLDQALVRIGAALRQLGDGEAEIRRALAELRVEVENAMAAGYGPKAPEREAFQEVTKLYSGRADLDHVLENLIGLVEERSGSDRAFFAWGGPDAAITVRGAAGFRKNDAGRVLSGLGRATIAELVADNRPLIATDPGADPRLKGLRGIERRDGSAALSVAIVPFQIPEQVQGIVFVERAPGNPAGTYRAADVALLAMLTHVVAIAAVESERTRILAASAPQERSGALAAVITQSSEMLRILKLLERVAATPARVLFLGETGTGKGLLATALHQMSPRAGDPFLQINCAALPEPLLESELFGHVQGAFTGAVREKRGLFEEAAAGTIFLDEIDKMSPAMQAKLLHVLDRQEVRLVGDTKWRQIRCRVASAANVDLHELIRKGDFLEDLYYRLNEFSVVVPPLRERPEDVLLLARHFIERSASRMGRHPRGLDPEVERLLLSYEWPGNVRELEKIVERMVVLAVDDAPLGLDLLPESFVRPFAALKSGTTLREEIRRLEARLIGQALRENGWNKLRTARTLKLSYPALLKKIREYDLDRRKPAPGSVRRHKSVNSGL